MTSMIKAEIDNTEQVVKAAMQRAIQEALQGSMKEKMPSEATFDIKQDEIKVLEKWAKKMYLHFPKAAASLIIDFVDEVHTGTFRLVKQMVDRTVYNAVATHLHVTSNITLKELRQLVPPIVAKRVRQKTAQILVALYQTDQVHSIAALHMEAALYRAADLTALYLEKRKTDLMQGSLRKVRCASQLTDEMNALHENAMNYFYRQAHQCLLKEQDNAKMQVQEKYPWAYRTLLQEKAFRKEMKAWLQTEIFPHVQHLKMAASSLSSNTSPSSTPAEAANNAMACF